MAGFTPALLERFRKETGATDPADYWDFEVREVGFAETRAKTDFSRYFPADLHPRITRVNEWGVGHIPGSSFHFEDYVHPMEGFTSLAELEAYPWPDVTAGYRRSNVPEEVEQWHARGYAVRAMTPKANGTLFENAWLLRGLERLLVDFIENEEFAAALLDRLCEFQVENARFLGNCRVDVLRTGDDVGTQRGMMMSPAMWRKWLKPRLARVIAAARSQKQDLHVFYHSDGDIRAIIPDLIEIGVDVLNPVQPECMDPAELKRLYGDRLAFWGTVGTQTTMPFGSPAEVKRVVKERIRTVGKHGGLLLAPTHVLEPDVPWENVVAFFEAAKEYGRKG
jgi:uroporphyrinogen decarboxylase